MCDGGVVNRDGQEPPVEPAKAGGTETPRWLVVPGAPGVWGSSPKATGERKPYRHSQCFWEVPDTN